MTFPPDLPRRTFLEIREALNLLKEWAQSSRAENDIYEVFGVELRSGSASEWLWRFRAGDFSKLPPIRILSAEDMPGLFGGYSRETGEVYLSADCPREFLAAVLIEEIGHFLDHDLCEAETPGDEGARFSATVLDHWISEDEASCDDRGTVFLKGRPVPVEASRINRRSGARSTRDTEETKDGSVVYAIRDKAWIQQRKSGQRLIGSKGNDTFYVIDDPKVKSDKVSLEDRLGGDKSIDLAISERSLDLSAFSRIEHLHAVDGTKALTLGGNASANFIKGNSGNNSLDGREGRDTLVGGAGHDVLNGGLRDGAADSLVGGAGNDTYYIESLNDVILENAGGGIDFVITSNREINRLTFANIENFLYTGPQSSTGSSLDDFLIGDESANNLSGLAGDDTLDAKGGNDSLNGGLGDDSMVGGSGNDTYVVDSLEDIVLERADQGTDWVFSSVSHTISAHVENLVLTGVFGSNGTGNAQANSISGNAGKNSLSGGGGSDTLSGAGGDDVLDGGAGQDFLRGGTGNDSYVVDSLLDRIDERKGEGEDFILSSISYDLGNSSNVSGVEHLIYTGTRAATLTGDSGSNILRIEKDTLSNNDTLIGGAGDDTLSAGAGTNSLVGGSGDDVYIIQSKTDRIVERNLQGNDWALSRIEQFSLAAGSSIEFLTYEGRKSATLTGNEFDNIIIGEKYGNSLSGGGGDDSIVGGIGSDTLIGGEGSDTLDGKGGSDTLIGGNGDDHYFAYSQSQVILEESDNATSKDTVYTSQEFSLQYSSELANIENLQFTGNSNITGTGNSLNNLIAGNDGANELFGRTGNDTIFGGLGSDTIGGEEGDDLIVGGGSPRGDIKPDRSTPVTIGVGDSFFGTFDRIGEGLLLQNFDSDWIRAELRANVTYEFSLEARPAGVPAAIRNSLFYLGNPVGPSDDPLDAEVIFNSEDPEKVLKILITPFSNTEVYIPVNSAGPALGSYKLELKANVAPSSPVAGQILADDASNVLVGGLGKDTLVSGNGRDSDRNPIGDLLLGGTNQVFGRFDTDESADTLIGGDGNDSLDGGNGANSLVGGRGNDVYYLRSSEEIIFEAVDQGDADALIVGFAARTGQTWDIDLSTTGKYRNIEFVTLAGETDFSVLGNGLANNISGNLGNNTINSGAGDDSLYGDGGNDSLVGGAGADFLDGGSGQNTMSGGSGADTYVVNDRNDRIIQEIAGFNGGVDFIFTNFNFDPIQGDGVKQFDPLVSDNSPSVTKSPSFASLDLTSFYNLEHFSLAGGAVYGVGNALENSISAGPAAALLLGMGGADSLRGGAGNDSLFGDTPWFYASPDLYAAAPNDTRTQEFLDKVIGLHGRDLLEGGAGDDYLDGGRGADRMIGGAGNNVFVQDNLNDQVIAAGGGVNELISSVNIAKAPDGISKIMLVVANQSEDSGQTETANFASFLNSKGGNLATSQRNVGTTSFTIQNANVLELIYSPRPGAVYTFNGSNQLNFDTLNGFQDDLENPGKRQIELSWEVDVEDLETIVGYTVRYRRTDIPDIWHTYVVGKSQDFQGIRTNPALTVNNLAPDGTYDFDVTAHEIVMPVSKDRTAARYVTLQGGSGSDAVIGTRYSKGLPGGLTWDDYTDPIVWNNPIAPLPLGLIFNPAPFTPGVRSPFEFATYLDGGSGNDFLDGAFINDGSGDDYSIAGITAFNFRGLNTLVGGQGSDTFVVTNGGRSFGDEFDHVIKYGNETPVIYGSGGVGASLNGGQHNLVVSTVPYLVLSDTLVSQGKFIDQLALSRAGQFGMGNRLDNFLTDGFGGGGGSNNTLVGGVGRDSIRGGAVDGDVLIGGTAYGVDNVAKAVQDFASKQIGGYELENSIYRDTDPIPVGLNGPAKADPSQFWFVPGYYGEVFDPARNRDTLVAADASTLDGGAGNDSLVGSQTRNDKGDNFFVSCGPGGIDSQNISVNDAVFGNGGNDTVTFTDSDYLWWSGHQEGALLNMNGYSIARDISNLVLQMGAPTARNGTGNRFSTGNDHGGWFEELGSNLVVGNEFDNILNGGGVGGDERVGGVDTLRGGLGSDLFVVNGYIGASNTKWQIDIERDRNDSRFWDIRDSDYSDADYVIIEDFSFEDYLDLEGGNWWIGRAPSFFGENNLRPATDNPFKGISSSEFGIYRSGVYDPDAENGTGQGQIPDLIAVVRTVDGLELDLSSLVEVARRGTALRPEEGLVDRATAAAGHQGWGAFFSWSDAILSYGSDTYSTNDFVVGQGGIYIQEQSTASVSKIFLAGSNTFQGTAVNDTFNGFGGNDTLRGAGGNDTLWGGNGQDSLLGEAGNDSLLGEAGLDFIDGGAGNDTLLGGEGNDNLLGGNDADSLLGDAGNDILLGGAGNDTLLGGSGNDYLDGGAGVNSLLGGAGNDTLVWATGNATLDGGGGLNTLLFSTAVNLTDLDFGVISNFSQLAFSDQNDRVSLGANARIRGFTIIDGNGGNDTLDALTMTDSVTISGGAGNDSLLGGVVADSVAGGAGNDILLGESGNDTLLGEGGNDSLVGGAGDDSLAGGAGLDTISGGSGNDSFLADASGSAQMNGGDDEDSFLIASGAQLANNTLVGGRGIDAVLLTTSATLVDVQFANTREVESIMGSSLGGDSITLGFNAQNGGVLTLVGGSNGGDTLSAAGYDSRGKIVIDASASAAGSTLEAGLGVSAFGGGNTIIGGQAGDLILISSAPVLQSASLLGGGGLDTLQVASSSQVFADADLAAISGMEVLQFSAGANSITLGATARSLAMAASENLSLVVGGAGSDTLNVDSSFVATGIVLDGGAGDDAVIFSSAAQLVVASLTGGAGIDTLHFSAAIAGASDSSFERIAAGSIEVLALSSGTNTLEIGSNAQAAGIQTVVGGIGVDSIDASSFVAALVFDATANSQATLAGGSGRDLFLLRNNNVLAVSSLNGGGGEDTVSFTEDGLSITDESFSRFSDIEAMLARDGTNFMQLGVNAGTARINSITSGNGQDTIEAAAYTGAGLSINSGGNDDFITLLDANALQSITIDGGAQAASGIGDVLAFEQATTLVDSGLANVTNVEVLIAAASGNSSLTVGNNAQRGGIRTVIGGDDNDFLSASTYTIGVTLDGGAGNDNLVISTGARLFQSQLIGGAGTDTLSFAVDALSVTDSDFNNLGSNTALQVEVLLTANGNNRFLLGTNAENAGIDTILGGTGNDTLSASGFASSVILEGGAGNDSITGGGGADRISGTSAISAGANQRDTLTGGAGSDVFVLGDAAVAYYVSAANGGDYAVIRDFAVGDRLLLKTLNASAAGNGYVVGSALYGSIGSSNHYLYSDVNNNGSADTGDNLIAAINSSVTLTTANLKSTHGSFV